MIDIILGMYFVECLCKIIVSYCLRTACISYFYMKGIFASIANQL